MKASATQLNKHSGYYLNQAIKEPVIIEKTGQPIAVIVSYDLYFKLEDAYWGGRAIEADKEPSLGVKASTTFLKNEDESGDQ